MRVLIAIHGSTVFSDRMAAQIETWIPEVRRVVLPRTWRDGCLQYRWFVERPFTAPDTETLPWDAQPLWITHGPLSRRTPSTNMKTRALVEFAMRYSYDYVFKCDDDTYVRPQLLIDSGFEDYLYSGGTEQHNADDVGTYSYAGGGGGYWLSRTAMLCVLQGPVRHPACDVNVGQVLAAAGIKPHHDARYHNAVTEEDRLHPPADAITLHKCEPDQMRIVHRALHGE